MRAFGGESDCGFLRWRRKQAAGPAAIV